MNARQSTARTFMVGPVLDADGVAVTDCVVGDFKVSKNGAAPAALNGSSTLTHRHTGFYSLASAAGDFDTVGTAQFTIDDTTNACAPVNFDVVEEAVYDALFAASAAGYQVPIWAAANSTVNLSGTTIKEATDVQTTLTNRLVGTIATGTHNPQSGDAYAIVNNGTHGNAALKTLIDAVDNFVDSEIADIQARLPAALTADGLMKADTLRVGGTLQTAGDLKALLDAIDDYVDTEVAAIKAKTDNLPSDPADASDIASAFSTVNSTLATIAAYIDTEIAAIKAKTDNLPSDPADASDVAASFVKIRKYLQLLTRKDAAIATDNATELTELNADGGSGAGAYSNQTDALEANRDNIGTNGASLSSIPWNASWDAEVQSEVADALDAAVPGSPTSNSINERIKTLDDNYTSVRAALLDNLDLAISTVSNSVTQVSNKIGAFTATGVNTILGFFRALLRKDVTAPTDIAGNYDPATDSLEAIRDRGDAAWGAGAVPSAAAIADAVWDEAIADHLTAGSTGAKLNSAASAGDPWSTSLPGSYAAGTAGYIIGSRIPVKTDQIGTTVEINGPISGDDEGNPRTLTVLKTDDYTATTGQQVSTTVEGWPAFPSSGVKLRISRNGALVFSEVSVTVTANGSEQTLTADLTRTQVAQLQYGALDDFRFEVTFGNGDKATPAWGKVEVVKVGF